MGSESSGSAGRAAKAGQVLLVFWTALLLAGPLAARDKGELDRPPPEAAVATRASATAISKDFMVVAAHPLAAEAGATMLRAGGSAVDAAIAVQMVLNLVEPQSSGIGGGALAMLFDGRTVRAFDGRETAPREVREDLFLQADGKPMDFQRAVVGGRSVGTPGVVRLLEMLHHRYGRLPWADLFAPAIHLAEHGFPVGQRLHALLEQEKDLIADSAARAYFYSRDGSPWPVGHVLRNPELAGVFRLLARDGAEAFYSGPLAADMVAKVRGHLGNAGLLDEADLAAYWPVTREPVCMRHSDSRVCGFPPPSSGGIAVAQILGIAGRLHIADFPPERRGEQVVPAAAAVHRFVEAGRLAFADRAAYVADPAFQKIPDGLLDASYLDSRSRLVGERSLGKAAPGRQPGYAAAGDATDERPATSHIAIVDSRGMALSLTTTIEAGFGSRIMVRGFLLNNQLTDFSFVPVEDGRPVANRVQPGKRPRSSMAPTIVLDGKGGLQALLGSPGGPWIINYVAETLVGLLDWHLPLDEAIALPHFGSRNGPAELEAGAADLALRQALIARGHEVVEVPMPSGLAGIARTSAGWFGAADPRREGAAVGR